MLLAKKVIFVLTRRRFASIYINVLIIKRVWQLRFVMLAIKILSLAGRLELDAHTEITPVP
jgi:hypothetical protein